MFWLRCRKTICRISSYSPARTHFALHRFQRDNQAVGWKPERLGEVCATLVVSEWHRKMPRPPPPESQCCSRALISGNLPQVSCSEENPAFFHLRQSNSDKAFDVKAKNTRMNALLHFEAPCCSATLENSFHVLIARHMMSPSMKGEARLGIKKKKEKEKKVIFAPLVVRRLSPYAT